MKTLLKISIALLFIAFSYISNAQTDTIKAYFLVSDTSHNPSTYIVSHCDSSIYRLTFIVDGYLVRKKIYNVRTKLRKEDRNKIYAIYEIENTFTYKNMYYLNRYKNPICSSFIIWDIKY